MNCLVELCKNKKVVDIYGHSVYKNQVAITQLLKVAMCSGSGNADTFSNIVDRRRAVMLLIILVDELQYPVQSFLILCSHISTSVSIWDLKSHNVLYSGKKEMQ